MIEGGGPVWLAGMFGICLVPGVHAAHDNLFAFQFDLLGAPAQFAVTALTRDAARLAVASGLAEIERLERLLSAWRPDSELQRLNRVAEMTVSPELFAVLDMAEALHAASGGAFSARLGAVENLWRGATTSQPDAGMLRRAAEGAEAAPTLDAASRRVTRPEGVIFSIDALAKGFIIDRALDAAMATGLATGMMLDIGGDMRARGPAGTYRSWPVGLPDPRLAFVNAPLVAGVMLRDQAIATSGKGPRDRVIGDAVHSTTLSPHTGQPVRAHLSASVIAPTAAKADGLATALMVMAPEQGLALARASGAEARITKADGAVLTTPGWDQLAVKPRSSPPLLQMAAESPRLPAPSSDAPLGSTGWVIDWALQVFYEAPPVDIAGRSADYRSPYLVMWISDKQNHPIRTLVLVGKDPEWQKDNHIWWSLYGARAPKLVEFRSTGTALSGRYPTFWPGYNDDFKFLAIGDYLLNIETSRERGQHTFRQIPVSLGRKPFEMNVPPSADMGQLTLAYGKQP